jgi:urease accessory protein
MSTKARTEMTEQVTPAWVLGLLQMASPALPIGAFSYSQGLEQAHAQGWVLNEQAATQWISSQWQCAFAPRELVALRQAYLSSELETILIINNEFLASRDAAEMRSETLQTGNSLMKWLKAMAPNFVLDITEQNLIHALQPYKLTAPVAFSVCAKAQRLPLNAALLAWGWSWLENQVQACVKIIPLGQTAGQRMLLTLRPLLLADEAIEIDVDGTKHEPWAFSPLASIAAMRHERLYTRIFRS